MIGQLKKYRGRNPKPEDFDEYWEKALKEMRAVNPKIELKKAKFQTSFAECFDLFFTGVRGARVHAKLARPKNIKKPCPALLIFHGYSCNAGDWTDMKMLFAAEGFVVAALDCRGQGGLSEDTGGVTGNTLKGHIIRGLDDDPQNLLFRHIFLDTAQLASIVMSMPEVDKNKVCAFGASQGGGLTLACTALEPGIKKAVFAYPFLCDYKQVWEMNMARDAYEEITLYFRFFDPLHKREDEIFTKLGYIDVQHLAPRIKTHVMMQVGLKDTLCPPITQFAAFNKIKSKKELLVYPDFGHDALPESIEITFNFFSDLKK
jgi:cephalosporin-C deacetylase